METTAALKIEEPRSANSGLEPETILPAQYFDRVQIDASLQAEKRLMLAVLEDAVDCYQKYAHARDPRGQQMFEESKAWVTSTDRSWLFSFENICDTLEISAEYVRRGLREWAERNRDGRRPKLTLNAEAAAALGEKVSA